MNAVDRARHFATMVHRGHKRKYTDDPYIIHPEAVSRLVVCVEHTEAMLCAAWLHDVVEDCAIELSEIRTTFGDEVADLVGWLTDVSKPEDGNRAVRKKLDREHLAQAPAAAQTIKVADLCDNTSSILAHDPKFAVTYLEEARLLLQVLDKADPVLRALLRDRLDGVT